MGRKPCVSDFGGNNIRRGFRARFSTETMDSFSCLECGTRRYVTKIEQTRVARPKCMACGGTLQETQATRKRHKPKRQSVVETHPRCRACGCRLVSAKSLELHLYQEPECADCYRENPCQQPSTT